MPLVFSLLATTLFTALTMPVAATVHGGESGARVALDDASESESVALSAAAKEALGVQPLAAIDSEDPFTINPEVDFIDPFDLGSAAAIIEVAKHALKGLVVMNNGKCPKSVPVVVGLDNGYDYGLGCAWEELNCNCPGSPFYVCAHKGRFSEKPSGQPMTDAVVSMLGYCRIGTWVFVLIAIAVLSLLYGAFWYYKRSRQSGGHQASAWNFELGRRA